MLNWAQRFNIFCFLDNHQYEGEGHRYEWLLAAGAKASVSSDHASIEEIDVFLEAKDWAFGHLSYELKDRIFGFNNHREDPIGFPLFFFFEPEVLLSVEGKELQIEADDPDEVYKAILSQEMPPFPKSAIHIQQELSEEEYIKKIQALQEHIRRGDCYEINFCLQFSATEAASSPMVVYQDLVKLSPTPFSAFYKVGDSYLLSASPERFLQKRGRQLIAQPMKGTAKRNTVNEASDQLLIKTLRNSQKEQSENVMIVDLMRNDLSKICEDGTVKVTELFGVQSFSQVHQLVSTIEGELQEGISFSRILEATFPMGSMTGAPKKRVLELINQYESTARGIFSGSVGYFHRGDFDFNVVIRSVMYNQFSQHLSYKVGSGITIYSNPQAEWEECLLKGEAIKKVLT